MPLTLFRTQQYFADITMYLNVTDSRGRLYTGLLLAETIDVATYCYILTFIAAPPVDTHILP